MEYAVEKDSQEKTTYTVEAYFALEAAAEYRSEFHNGIIKMMAGASKPHELICFNVYALIHAATKGKNCRGYGSNMKLWIESRKKVYYPDAMVICGKSQYKTGTNAALTNPVCIIEVLSESTEHLDRGEKFIDYQQIPGFREYMLISQQEPAVETFFRQEEKTWLYRRFTDPGEQISIHSIGATICLGDLYENVEFDLPELQAGSPDAPV